MDKEFILRHLKKEHLAGNEGLSEIAEMSGLDIVKDLFRNHETMRDLYIPMLNNNKELMKEVIKKNKDKFSICQLANMTGLTRKRIEKLIDEVERNN